MVPRYPSPSLCPRSCSGAGVGAVVGVPRTPRWLEDLGDVVGAPVSAALHLVLPDDEVDGVPATLGLLSAVPVPGVPTVVSGPVSLPGLGREVRGLGED